MQLLTKLIRANFVRFHDYRRLCHEIGIYGTGAFLFQRALRRDHYKLRVSGIPTTVVCRSNATDFVVLRQVLGYRDVAVDLARTPKVIVDAGANVGYASLVFATHYPTASIIAIEPDKTNCEVFRVNCAAYGNIRLLEGAVWPRHATLAIANPKAAEYEFQVKEANASSESRCVTAYTIPEIVEMSGGARIDLLKLDIEGAECALFSEGADQWLHLVDVLVVELHDRYVPGCSAALDHLLMGVPHTREHRGEYLCVRLQPSE